jgi:hypothetical protein
LAVNPAADVHFDFQLGPNETVLLHENFEKLGHWRLSQGLQIQSGHLSYHTSNTDYALASYPLHILGSGAELDPRQGPINLYWRALYPTDPDVVHKELNAYMPALQYAQNPYFCWNGQGNDSAEVVVANLGEGCPNSSRPDRWLKIREDAELRAWLRPTTSREGASREVFTRLYVDPDFTPGVEPEERDPAMFPWVTLDNLPNSQTAYRLRVEQQGQTIQVELFYLTDNRWQAVPGGTLGVDRSQWRFVSGQEMVGQPIYQYGVSDPITFTALNILLRNNPKASTKIDAIILTQEY